MADADAALRGATPWRRPGERFLNWIPAYVGLGSNLDDPESRIRRAFDALPRLPETRLVCRSALYRSRALGGLSQPDYVNAAAGLLTRLEPAALLDALLEIETAQGRQRTGERWAARTLDLDLLVYGGAVIDRPRLRVPHPGICSRNFVLFPLLDIAPDLAVPGLGTVRQLAAVVGEADLLRIAG